MLPHLLTNFKTKKCYQTKPKSNGVYSRNNLGKRKNRTFVINLDEHKSIRIHLIALSRNGDHGKYFDGIGFEHTPNEIKRIISNKNIETNI